MMDTQRLRLRKGQVRAQRTSRGDIRVEESSLAWRATTQVWDDSRRLRPPVALKIMIQRIQQRKGCAT
ncbi:hypothetical protein BDW74DRAFT_160610 [Aspergillus multicolor]|uniref:uncharacterized protein n=1 Tax=Aspergillus multicolor TaxID=41759 RepID=UPI003CCD086E